MSLDLRLNSYTSAPVLTGENAKLVNLLKAVLVDGFGSYGPLGGTAWNYYLSGDGNRGLFQPPAGNQRWLYVRDDGNAAGGVQRTAQTIGYIAATGFDGSNAPTGTAGAFGSAWWPKSFSADATARGWGMIGDDRGFWFWVNWGSYGTDTGTPNLMSYFGDFYSFVPSDVYNTLLLSSCVQACNAVNDYAIQYFSTCGAYNATQTNHAIARDYLQTTADKAFGKSIDSAVLTSNVPGYGGYPFPNPVDGSLLLCPIVIHETNLCRGYLPGVYAPLHDRPFRSQVTIDGSGPYAGRQFRTMLIPYNANWHGQVLIDVTGPWR